MYSTYIFCGTRTAFSTAARVSVSRKETKIVAYFFCDDAVRGRGCVHGKFTCYTAKIRAIQ